MSLLDRTGSLLTRSALEAAAASDRHEGVIDRKSVWGLYCMYTIVGLVNGFMFSFINIPICTHVFGPVGVNVTPEQCQIAQSVFQLPWNVKIFIAFFMESVGSCLGRTFFGRRRGWIILGWTGALLMMCFIALRAERLVEEHNFTAYLFMYMGVCACYIFSDVAGDGMSIELSKFEPEECRGYILATGQMCRFVALVCSNVVGILVMNGPTYNPDPAAAGDVTFSFELPFGTVHFLLVALVLPFYIGMVVMLRDPPPPQARKGGGEASAHGLPALWMALKSNAVFMLIVMNLGIIGLGGFQNPNGQAIINITNPTAFQQGIGNIGAYILFSVGIWAFRTYFMNRNWRITLLWTTAFQACNQVALLAVIYNWGGFCQNGWGYVVGSNIMIMVQGVGQVLSSLAVVEISPPGMEATIYELLATIHNGAITFSAVFTNLFMPVFDLDDIPRQYAGATAEQKAIFNSNMVNATWFTIGVVLLGAFGFMFFMPRNKEECREWRDRKSWHIWQVAVLNIVVAGVPCAYGMYESISQAIS